MPIDACQAAQAGNAGGTGRSSLVKDAGSAAGLRAGTIEGGGRGFRRRGRRRGRRRSCRTRGEGDPPEQEGGRPAVEGSVSARPRQCHRLKEPSQVLTRRTAAGSPAFCTGMTPARMQAALVDSPSMIGASPAPTDPPLLSDIAVVPIGVRRLPGPIRSLGPTDRAE